MDDIVHGANDGQSKYWIFTANNPSAAFVFDGENVSYAVYQLESAPTTGTEHFQGFICFQKKRTFGSVKSYFDTLGFPGIHIDRARAKDLNKARDYCMKEDTRIEGPWEFGEWTQKARGQGARSDLLEIKTELDEGASISDIAENHFASWVRYGKSFQEYKTLKSTVRTWKTKVVYIYGPTGTGKSRCAFERWPDAYIKEKGKWWDGYTGEETIILDDFDGSWFTASETKRILDRYGYRGEIKGSHIQLVPKTICITSNHLPWDRYSKSTDTDAICRRIDEWYWFKTPEEHLQFQVADDFRNAIFGVGQ
ncbi:replication-associated protein [Capybara virus 14_cap1_266]|nr:replication-associated protein [Capybara virus 14_cap1_266]